MLPTIFKISGTIRKFTPLVEWTFISTAEAAFIAEVSDRDMNRVVDERMLPESLARSDDGRFFSPFAAALARFYFSTEDIYVARLRLRVLGELTARVEMRKDRASVSSLDLFPQDFNWQVEVTTNLANVLVDASAAVRAAFERMCLVREASKLVSVDPEVMGGIPVFAGSRLPEENLAASLNRGIDKQLLAESWPFLTKKHFEAAKVYVRTHPKRGRPRRLAESNPDWKILNSEVVRLARP